MAATTVEETACTLLEQARLRAAAEGGWTYDASSCLWVNTDGTRQGFVPLPAKYEKLQRAYTDYCLRANRESAVEGSTAHVAESGLIGAYGELLDAAEDRLESARAARRRAVDRLESEIDAVKGFDA